MKTFLQPVVSKFTAVLLAVALVLGVGTCPVAAADSPPGREAQEQAVTVDGVEYRYQVSLPAGYDGANDVRKYPVLYVMPDDGLAGTSQAVKDSLYGALDSTDTVDAIVVEPTFESPAQNSGQSVYQAVDAIVHKVDEEFHTVSGAAFRAVIGAQTGGYLASILTYTDGNGNWNGEPQLFGMMASINGDFQSGNNVWKPVYGDFYDIATNQGTGNGNFSNQTANKFYTYMDAASEDANAFAEKGANDIISYYIKRGGAYGGFYYSLYGNADSYALDLTVKNSAYDNAFIAESVKEAVGGIGNKLVQGMVTGKVLLTPQAALASEPEVNAVYEITVGDRYSQYCGDTENEMAVTISMTDAQTGETVAEGQKATFPVKGGDTLYTNASNPFKLPNKIDHSSANVTLSCTVLGKDIVLDTKPLVRITATGTAPEDQLIDLLGSWKFKPFKDNELVAGVLPQESEYADWEEVYPCLAWWNSDFSKNTDMNNYAGYAWYVKEFEIPDSFPQGEYVVPVGCFDETDICFINGQQIGCTGLNEQTWLHEKDCWDTERIYSINSEYLHIGDGVKNVMVVLTHNNSGGGGWYSGHPGLYSAAAYNKLTSKPSIYASNSDASAVKQAVDTQIKAIVKQDINAYGKTVDPAFFQSGVTKEMLLEDVQGSYLGSVTNIEDTNAYVFVQQDLFYYQADRTLTKTDGSTETQKVAEYYKIKYGTAYLYGQHDRFYTQSIDSKYKAQAVQSEEEEAAVKEAQPAETLQEDFLVYLPEGYFDAENADKRYPTAYVFHQLNSSSNSYAIDGIDKLLDEGIASGRIQDTILVIPDSKGDSWWHNGWDLMVTEEILPFIDAHYRTIPDARYRFTAGASMGGSGSYYIGLTHPDLFSGIISFFGAINMGENPLQIAQAQSDAYLDYYTHYFVSGNRDLYKFGIPAIALDQRLRQGGIAHFFELEEGEHDSPFYLPYVIDAFAYQTDALKMMDAETAKQLLSDLSINVSRVDANTVEVTYAAGITQALKNYFNTIPASEYTKEANPPLRVPVTVRIEQNGSTVASYRNTVDVTADTVALSDTVKVNSMDLNTDSYYTVKVTAGIFNQGVLIGERKVGQTSSSGGSSSGGSSSGGSSSGSTGSKPQEPEKPTDPGSGTVTPPEEPGPKDDVTVTTDTKEDGTTVVTQTTKKPDGTVEVSITETKPDGTQTVTSIKTENGVTNEIAVQKDAAGNTLKTTEKITYTDATYEAQVVIKTVKDKNNAITSASTVITKEAEAGSGNAKAVILGPSIKEMQKKAGTDNLKVKVKMVDKAGKKLYTLTVDSANLTAGNVLYLYAYNSATKKYTMVNAISYTVSRSGNLSLRAPKGSDYILLNEAKSQKVNKSILKTVKLQAAQKTVKVGRKLNIPFYKQMDMANVAKITYSSSNTKIASVSKDGVVKAKKKGNVVVKVKVAMKNGSTKTLSLKLKVKKA